MIVCSIIELPKIQPACLPSGYPAYSASCPGYNFYYVCYCCFWVTRCSCLLFSSQLHTLRSLYNINSPLSGCWVQPQIRSLNSHSSFGSFHFFVIWFFSRRLFCYFCLLLAWFLAKITHIHTLTLAPTRASTQLTRHIRVLLTSLLCCVLYTALLLSDISTFVVVVAFIFIFFFCVFWMRV